MLSSTVTGGTWPSDITYERVVQEKGVGFQPGGEIPDSVNNCMVIYGPGISSKLWQISFWIALIYT